MLLAVCTMHASCASVPAGGLLQGQPGLINLCGNWQHWRSTHPRSCWHTPMNALAHLVGVVQRGADQLRHRAVHHNEVLVAVGLHACKAMERAECSGERLSGQKGMDSDGEGTRRPVGAVLQTQQRGS